MSARLGLLAGGGRLLVAGQDIADLVPLSATSTPPGVPFHLREPAVVSDQVR
jgi:hypothetical protein